MARWIGADTLNSGKCNIQGMVRANNAAGLARYIDITRTSYRNATDAKERAMLVQVGKLAQAALVRMQGAPHPKEGWTARSEVIIAESGG